MLRDKLGRFWKRIRLTLDPTKPMQVRTLRRCQLVGIYIPGLGVVYAGPFKNKPKFLKGVSLRPEDKGAPGVFLSYGIQDFSTPQDSDEFSDFILQLIALVQSEGAVYLGCTGGLGRTGLVLAILFRIFEDSSGKAAVKRVRAEYSSSAVETEDQEAFIERFDATPFKYISKMV